ncbi:MAG: hypothetical protein M3512_11310 [Bacteroidota bacterium]|nr:hypothetical protein [Bacteroidota bacterium]
MIKKNGFAEGLKSIAELDLRALAILRILISMVLLADLTIRITDLSAFYTNDGVLPLEILFRHLWDHSYFSIFTGTSNYYLQVPIFVLYFICIICLMLGYKTRLFTIFTWLFLMSLHSRNPLILQGADHFIRLIVFWAIFLPWGYLYSIDSYKNIAIRKSYSYRSIATFAYICQIAFLYIFSALLKDSPEWHTDFTALYYALSLDQLVTPIGSFIYPHFEFLRLLTAVVYYIELFLPLLLFIPFYNAWFRMGVIIVVVLMQIGIYMTVNVGLFSITSIVAMAGLLPTHFIDKWASSNTDFVHRWKTDFNRFMLRFANLTVNETIAPPKSNNFTGIFVGFCLLYVLGWNLNTIGKKAIPDNMIWIGNLLRIHQYWSMFAPAVYKDDGWFIFAGTTTNGKEIDLNHGNPLTYQKPNRVTDFIKNDRWRKYNENILIVSNSYLRPYYCQFILNTWNDNSQNTEKVINLKIIYMLEITLPDYMTEEPTPLELCTCTAKY